MQKLLEKYRAARNADNARKVIDYLNKHPMSECLLTVEDSAVLKDARAVLWLSTIK